MKMIDGFPRRSRLDYMTSTEITIRNALLEVEDLGAHELLTEAVVLLDAAREKVADWVELEENKNENR
jgi:hypothetical protein